MIESFSNDNKYGPSEKVFRLILHRKVLFLSKNISTQQIAVEGIVFSVLNEISLANNP